MSHSHRRAFLSLLFGAAVGPGLASSLWAQEEATLTRGFEVTIKPYTTGTEVARQLAVWEMEVQMKPMRMITLDLPNEKQEMVPQQVLYLAYRTIPRPIIKNETLVDITPVNELDPSPGPNMFIPQLTLVTYEDPKTEIPLEIHVDRPLPVAIPAINKIERPARPDTRFLDSVSVTRPVPDPIAADAPEQPWIYGVATWTGVDAKTDFFKVILQGFSNVYEIRGEGDEQRAWRKVMVQRFTSRGDEFDPNQREFEFDRKPFWEYQPDKKSKSEIARDRAQAKAGM